MSPDRRHHLGRLRHHQHHTRRGGRNAAPPAHRAAGQVDRRSSNRTTDLALLNRCRHRR
jgi:hypothetical protein